MKNKQKAISKILLLVLVLCAVIKMPAQTPHMLVEKADSLFERKQYTQSLDVYKEILSQHNYSESLLLKMAFIEEGLGHLSESLYYLNLYHLTTNDKQALSKIEEYAAKHHLSGYKPDQTRQFHSLLKENYNPIVKILVGLVSVLFALLIYMKKGKKNLMPIAISILIVMAALFFHVNFSQKSTIGIVHRNSTYLMSGPSAGSSVVSIIDEGHLVDVLGKKDVWIRVKWLNQDVYLKGDQVLMIEL